MAGRPHHNYVFESVRGLPGSDVTLPVLYLIRQNPFRGKLCLGKKKLMPKSKHESKLMVPELPWN